MNPQRPSPDAVIDSLRRLLHARAAGWWERAFDRLELLAFAAADDMPAEVAEGFAAATRSVPLDRPELGVVRAVLDARPVVSRVEQLPPDAGSGLWLRRFGATRSVAVPVLDGSGRVVRVVSVALLAAAPDDDEVVQTVLAAAETGLDADQAPE
jgi:hypothetical protein